MLVILFEEIDIRRQEKIIERANLVHSLICSDKIDISVMVFELMYEVLRLWGIESEDMRNDWIDCFTGKGAEVLKFITKYGVSSIKNENILVINSDFYGSVYFFFWKIFDIGKDVFVPDDLQNKLQDELEIAKKYCKLCEIIR